MPSHKTLALLALAASTASPALSAPVLEGQKEARASVAIPSIGDIVKTVGSGLAFGALPVVLQNVLGGNSTRRDLPARIIVDGRPVDLNNGDSSTSDTNPPQIVVDGLPVGLNNSDSSTSDTTPAHIIVDGLPAPLSSRGVVKTSDSLGSVITRREPSPLSASDLTGIGKTILGLGTSLAAASGVKELLDSSPRDLSEVLQLDRRHLDERGVISNLVNAVKTSDSIGKVVGEGLLGGVTTGLGAIATTQLLNNTRRDSDVPHADVGTGPPPQFLVRDLISALDIVSRQLAELD